MTTTEPTPASPPERKGMDRAQVREFLEWMALLIPNGAPSPISTADVDRWHGANLEWVTADEAHTVLVALAETWREDRWPLPVDFSEQRRRLRDDNGRDHHVAKARQLIRDAAIAYPPAETP